MSKRRAGAHAALALLCLAHGIALHAQEIMTRLEVRVTDASGHPVAGARVEVVSPSRGVSRASGSSDEAGKVLLLALPPAPDYALTILKDGFRDHRIEGIALVSGEPGILAVALVSEDAGVPDADLQPGRDGRPGRGLQDPSSFGSSTRFQAASIESLPVIGRRYEELLTYAPGVTDTDRDGRSNVQGSRETSLQHRLGGADVTDPVSGSGGQALDFEVIEGLEMITSGAGASFGRAEGGFASITTKSGGNGIEGSLRLAWRGSFLDGNQATGPAEESDVDDLRITAAVGGPILRDRLWYFGAATRLDSTWNLSAPAGTSSQTLEGWNGFAKITWQAGPDDRLSLQVSADPRLYKGLFDGSGVSPESGSDWRQGGTAWTARWSHVAGSALITETSLSGYDTGISTDPASSRFHQIAIQIQSRSSPLATATQAVYPLRECSRDGTAQGFIPNCDPALGPISISSTSLTTGRLSGPASFEIEDDRERLAFRQELIAAMASGAGEHLLHGGVELTYESYDDDSLFNPFILDATQPCPACRDINGQPIPNAVTGSQTFIVPTPGGTDLPSEGTNFAAFLSDAWKPLDNLSITAGLRLDIERIESSGWSPFDPARDRRRMVATVNGLCAEGLRAVANGLPGQNTADTFCDPAVLRPFYGVAGNLVFPLDPNTPAWIRGIGGPDMVFDSGSDLVDGKRAWLAPLTDLEELAVEPVRLHNGNLSPRVGVAWDPWSDGMTKLFGSWGRYHDRVHLGVAAAGSEPLTQQFAFQPVSFLARFVPGQLSFSAPPPGIVQVDGDLSTPRSDVLTLGAERELAPAWSARVTWTQRMAFDLHQDRDANHAKCTDLQALVGVDPATVCTMSVDPNGVITLGNDLFGASPSGGLNGLTDLYALNPEFGRVLIVESVESSRYEAWTLELLRRRRAGWDLALSYTHSRAEGGGLSYGSIIRDDPTLRGEEIGYLDLDQRHRVMAWGTATLPLRVEVGWSLRWESGIPYSTVKTKVDYDDQGNPATRILYTTGERNDQRTPDTWSVDARVAKRFVVGSVSVSAELAVENLLDDDTPIYPGFTESGTTGIPVPGRHWEMGMVFRH